MPPVAVKLCDRLSRVDFGLDGEIYEPELEQRLVTLVLATIQTGGQDEGVLQQRLAEARSSMVLGRALASYPIDPRVRELYQRTRYTSTLYPDTVGTLHRLRGGTQRPTNMAILTYGDPVFQLAKTARLLATQEGGINQIWLTRVRKGDFFRNLLQVNPFRLLPLKYVYPETDRGAGINFQDWRIMVTLFDDDPRQVESFNSIAAKEKIAGLGVVRVRRAGVKRSDKPILVGHRAAEVIPSDTLLDTDIFQGAIDELSARLIEDFLIEMVNTHGVMALRDNQAPNLIAAIASCRSIDERSARDQFLQKAGLVNAGVFSTDDSESDIEIWSGVD